uniref:Uncharacterized protein n=1 Tax=Arundo donax TaxID=35708 RepID=A0A0A9HJZ3_ARUDO
MQFATWLPGCPTAPVQGP